MNNCFDILKASMYLYMYKLPFYYAVIFNEIIFLPMHLSHVWQLYIIVLSWF